MRSLDDARKLGAFRHAAEHAIEMLTAPPAYLNHDQAIASALYVLRIALAHDGSEDYFDRVDAARRQAKVAEA